MLATQARRVDPQRARIGCLRRRQVRQRPVGRNLGGDGARDAREQGDESERQLPARRDYGRTDTVE